MNVDRKSEIAKEQANLQSVNGHDREFVFTKKDFDRVCQLIYEHAGISLSASKQDMVYSRLARRLRVNGLDNFRDYLALLESNNAVEWEAFVNSLTTNLTSFFREPHHFPMLAEHVARQKGQHCALWCSAASTGEEAYSMAMTMVETFGSFTPPVSIIASDVDTNVLAKAAEGIYPLESLQLYSKNYLASGGACSLSDYYHVKYGAARFDSSLKKRITFSNHNLVEDHAFGEMNMVICRNVMIYFKKELQNRVLSLFRECLVPKGYLVLGDKENLKFSQVMSSFDVVSEKEKIYRIR